MMIVEKDLSIDFFDVDFESAMTFKAMARRFQSMATMHSDRVGAGHRDLKLQNYTWYLHRLKIQAVTRPMLYEKVRFSTWTRGMRKYKNFREYRITSPNGDVLVKGSGVWLFYDLAKKRIATIPEDISERYEYENIVNFDEDLDAWKPCGKIKHDRKIQIPLRYSDFDIQGHVNNTEYIGFLESMFHQHHRQRPETIHEICIRFYREVGMSCDSVQAGFKKQGASYLCNIFDKDTLYCDGSIKIMADKVPAP